MFPQPASYWSYLALLIAGLVFAIAVRSGNFVASGSDSSGYLSAAELWRSGVLYRPEPLHFWPAFPADSLSVYPLGSRAGTVPGTEVSLYPPGFPILIAAANTVVSPWGGHLVSPLFAALLVWCTFVIGRMVAGPLTGVLAASLLASSPVLLLQSVDVMSDVPATACWMGAWLFSLRGTPGASAAAGALTAISVLIRPNLAPLALVIAGTVLSHATGGNKKRAFTSAAIFCLFGAAAAAVLAWTQAVLYGSPFAPSYPGWSDLFNRSYIPTNVRLYPRLLSQVHTLLPVLGVLLIPLCWTRRSGFSDTASRRIVFSGVALLTVNLLLYLPYLPHDHWPFLRFMLPSLIVLFIFFSGVLVFATQTVWRRSKVAALVVPLLAVVVVAKAWPLTQFAINDWRVQASVGLMGNYLREVLPRNAIVLSYLYSGAIAYYTGRDVVRLDGVEPHALDRTIQDLQRRGYEPVVVIDQMWEEKPFLERYVNSEFGRLDWAPRAKFLSAFPITYYVCRDRSLYLQHQRWPVDTLR